MHISVDEEDLDLLQRVLWCMRSLASLGVDPPHRDRGAGEDHMDICKDLYELADAVENLPHAMTDPNLRWLQEESYARIAEWRDRRLAAKKSVPACLLHIRDGATG